MSLYSASVPVYVQLLGAMDTIIDKAVAQCPARKAEEAFVLGDRLYPDMFPLARQIQAVCDHAAGSCVRVAGGTYEIPPRTETTFAQLKQRVANAIAAVQAVKAEALDAGASKDVSFPMGPRTIAMRGDNYMLHYAMPNFYFHLTTAYDILRHRGFEVGKRDFLGKVVGFPAS
jgi:hypothetical protein